MSILPTTLRQLFPSSIQLQRVHFVPKDDAWMSIQESSHEGGPRTRIADKNFVGSQMAQILTV